MTKHPQKHYKTLNQDALFLISEVLDRHTKAVVEGTMENMMKRQDKENTTLRAAIEQRDEEWSEDISAAIGDWGGPESKLFHDAIRRIYAERDKRQALDGEGE